MHTYELHAVIAIHMMSAERTYRLTHYGLVT